VESRLPAVLFHEKVLWNIVFLSQPNKPVRVFVDAVIINQFLNNKISTWVIYWDFKWAWNYSMKTYTSPAWISRIAYELCQSEKPTPEP
jgi:hypothetical protein